MAIFLKITKRKGRKSGLPHPSMLLMWHLFKDIFTIGNNFDLAQCGESKPEPVRVPFTPILPNVFSHIRPGFTLEFRHKRQGKQAAIFTDGNISQAVFCYAVNIFLKIMMAILKRGKKFFSLCNANQPVIRRNQKPIYNHGQSKRRPRHRSQS